MPRSTEDQATVVAGWQVLFTSEPMNGKPVEVPSLDSLIADPGKVACLPAEVAQTFMIGYAAIHPLLIAQSLKVLGKPESPATPERFLTVKQVAEMFGVKPRWLRTHKDKLPHSKPSHKVLLFPEEKLRRWFAAHKAN